MAATATDKQVRYALYLMDKAGYQTTWMCAAHADLGATHRERSGHVDGWLESMPSYRISQLIDRLKA